MEERFQVLIVERFLTLFESSLCWAAAIATIWLISVAQSENAETIRLFTFSVVAVVVVVIAVSTTVVVVDLGWWNGEFVRAEVHSEVSAWEERRGEEDIAPGVAGGGGFQAVAHIEVGVYVA
mgnify:CR=1 FL=1